jgi:hypothetical protein
MRFRLRNLDSPLPILGLYTFFTLVYVVAHQDLSFMALVPLGCLRSASCTLSLGYHRDRARGRLGWQLFSIQWSKSEPGVMWTVVMARPVGEDG